MWSPSPRAVKTPTSAPSAIVNVEVAFAARTCRVCTARPTPTRSGTRWARATTPTSSPGAYQPIPSRRWPPTPGYRSSPARAAPSRARSRAAPVTMGLELNSSGSSGARGGVRTPSARAGTGRPDLGYETDPALPNSTANDDYICPCRSSSMRSRARPSVSSSRAPAADVAIDTHARLRHPPPAGQRSGWPAAQPSRDRLHRQRLAPCHAKLRGATRLDVHRLRRLRCVVSASTSTVSRPPTPFYPPRPRPLPCPAPTHTHTHRRLISPRMPTTCHTHPPPPPALRSHLRSPSAHPRDRSDLPDCAELGDLVITTYLNNEPIPGNVTLVGVPPRQDARTTWGIAALPSGQHRLPCRYDRDTVGIQPNYWRFDDPRRERVPQSENVHRLIGLRPCPAASAPPPHQIRACRFHSRRRCAPAAAAAVHPANPKYPAQPSRQSAAATTTGGSSWLPQHVSHEPGFSSDGYCDDGGPGSEYADCEYGTDRTDRGGRDAAMMAMMNPGLVTGGGGGSTGGSTGGATAVAGSTFSPGPELGRRSTPPTSSASTPTTRSRSSSRRMAIRVRRHVGHQRRLSRMPPAGFGSATAAPQNIQLPSSEFWLDNVNCAGYETTIGDCPANGWGNHNCGSYGGRRRSRPAFPPAAPPPCPALLGPSECPATITTTSGSHPRQLE